MPCATSWTWKARTSSSPRRSGRVTEITAELRNGMDVRSLGGRRQIADRHVLDHATTQRARLSHLKTSCLRGGLQHPRSFQTKDHLTTAPPLPRKRVRCVPGMFSSLEVKVLYPT